ncbi:MAG: transposase, partial [Nitrososphaera sp.]|nr:transposase [Nitrososphaera sp.]
MERKLSFTAGEFYHVYTRGVEKRLVFESDVDRDRFLLILLLCNGTERVEMRNIQQKYQGEPLVTVFELEKPSTNLVDIVCYSLMPNHIHLVLHEHTDGGISKFMLKLMTAYSMYFNKKNERSGPLFTRPFRANHIDSDEYFRWAFAYVLLNPLELYAPKISFNNLVGNEQAKSFMNAYRYSSFQDYYVGDRPETAILAKNALPFPESELCSIDDLIKNLSEQNHQGFP